ncbi:hypothetical protein GCM10007301_15680 [Azorhizobium oxalatiphilum]|uniref:Holin n=1 Tax=Azorhizobium oxalatiphilum TaxID=980631 RepID=A0A917F940_9HYPH|nr:hypothetical protein [Azorhizobium oxalatiphilum]GGF56846.1 hypothetical protein GCM10007301_15680 [Azorhizobium oxalatiphilum]
MEILLQRLIEWGPPGLVAALFGYLFLREAQKRDDIQQRFNDLQDRRVQEARDDIAKMTTAISASTDAVDTNTSSITALTRVVEATTRGGGR